MDLTQYRSKLIGSEDERAVSPVIGVILMVAITVILAAVIAAFVLDMGQSQSASASAAVQFEESGSTVEVTFVQADRLDEHSGSGTYALEITEGSGTNCEFQGDGSANVGGSATCDSSSSITVVGTYQGEQTVVANWDP
ncbi:type IV pilin N-terminal domain-containing protein [Natrinema sp. 1APR25-10V2]|uniref:type IV pilin N-terminal domain-containing protein n=1 Tax=Natrinema sp. 1APR25-10V2 TaxID=2951081 RepID=UPI0028763112|nr:type IV pilin N-terminal domain-containing protein [Natrinema sp. 1APR25-10V2]MDS0475279.1 type IV pilin N-terminal domain-containing protein [Natrinema sp. 1APR25-10V2]